MAIGLGVVLVAVGLFVAGLVLARRFEPYIRQQAIDYLSRRFNSQVELAALRVKLPNISPVRLALRGGKGALARVEGEGISLRYLGRRDIPPMFKMRKFQFDVDLGTLFGSTKIVPEVRLQGMEISIPPKGERPEMNSGGPNQNQAASASSEKAPSVLIEEVFIDDARLTILPKDPSKVPLRFDIHRVRLDSAGPGVAMKYDAALTNPKPPGEIRSQGVFGPWVTTEPGDTPLKGDYIFANADLGVFKGIAGILNSKGSFEGTLDSVEAQGEATVPDFRLMMSGNRVPLRTEFQVLVDGTNGNTILKPVRAILGSTNFTTSGGVIKHEGDRRRSITLDVSMPDGNLRDLLQLAMKGSPFMEGRILLRTRIEIPPLSGKVREKLILDGRFDVRNGKFLRSTVQEQIDQLSRRGQGEPKNQAIDQVVSRMRGAYHLEDEVITFRSLDFSVPGADVALAGKYAIDKNTLDFHGALKLQAKVSQTMTGWKHWVLKPVDPFFSKHGAGTYLRIKVEGTAQDPKFGRDSGH